jgi:penicillin-binding protein 2
VWQQDRRYIKDPNAEAMKYQGRAFTAIVVIALVFTVILARYVFLQVFQFERYKTEADNNRVHVQSLAPKRGLIFDRKGRLLAENISSRSLVLVRERVPNLEDTLARLQRLLDISDEDLDDFRRRLKRQRPFEEVPLLFNLSEEQIATVAVNIHTLPGVEIEARLVRHYPYGELFGHVVGYVGRINEREQATLDPENYAATYSMGKLGVERYYESQLHGEVGYQNVETDVRGRIKRVLDQTDPQPGKDLFLHLDVDIQRVAYEALRGRRGSVVAMNVKNGGVLAVVSSPSYDANLFVNGISSKDYSALRDSPDLPLFNRSLQGQYPPASTVKPVIGMAGLHYGVVTPSTTVADPGWFQLPNDERFYRDWKREGHAARINLEDSIIQSCDVFFYDLAYKLGIDRIHEFMTSFGYGVPTGVDLTSERGGLLPSRDWKRRVHKLPWFPGETLNIGIGQGYMLATPIQMAAATVALANKGQWIQPRVLNKLGELELLPARRNTLDVDPSHWAVVERAMYDVVHGTRGTARASARGMAYDMAGKTGTAQVVGIAQGEEYDSESLSKHKRDHALFVGYAPAEDPQIAVVVVIENGEHSSEAVKVARAVMDAYLLGDESPLGVNKK